MLNYFSGPPFTHQCTPEHMIYYGHSSCDTDLDRYLESLKSLWRRRSQSRETPVIINTMGWVKGQLRLLALTKYEDYKEYINCKPCLNMCLFGAVHRIWVPAASGHDPLLPVITCRPART